MKRKIIRIDEEMCNGCGECIPGCPEGALRIIDGKARLVSEVVCDGLGACLGHCPEGAIAVEEREAASYDGGAVMATLSKKGENAVRAHIRHLEEHGETTLLHEALQYLHMQAAGGCPGSAGRGFEPAGTAGIAESPRCCSQLSHWPVQLHLIHPLAPHFAGSDLLLSADCVAYAVGDFHTRHLKGRTLAIACPKLDDRQEIYLDKLTSLIDQNGVRSITVMIMQVPCCSGLLRLAQTAANRASRKIPVHCTVAGVQGQILHTT